MHFHSAKSSQEFSRSGFTLAEVLVSFLIVMMVVGGIIYGYTQANRIADYTSMSLAAESEAIQGVERVRAAQWDPHQFPYQTGPNTGDEVPANTTGPAMTFVDFMDVPSKGTPSQTDFNNWVTNYIYVTAVPGSYLLRQIQSDAVWTYAATGQVITNTVILLRAPDQ